ncbi:MAG: TerC family protein [Hyphomonadaceae bacterium]
MTDVLTSHVAGQPLWLWGSFLCGILFILWLDLGVLNRKDGVVSAGKSTMMWGAVAVLAVAFGGYVYFGYRPDPEFYLRPDNLNGQAVVQYFTGYLLETALAFDNIFVMSLVFGYFAVPREFQHRVLFWGILGAIVFRGLFIGAGAAIVSEFTWVLYIFAAFLIFTGAKMIFGGGEDDEDISRNPVVRVLTRFLPVTNELKGHNFLVRQADPHGHVRLYATPLLVALITIEFVDIIFAVDSVPAIFAVTRDPFIVYTSNIFAILGLRSLYFMLAAAVERFTYLKYGLSLVLVLIGGKIIWNFGLHKELKLVPYLDAHWSLIATLSLLIGAILFSLWATRKKTDTGS